MNCDKRSVVALVAAVAGCFPNFDGLTDGPLADGATADRTTVTDVASSREADGVPDCLACDAGIEAEADATIDPCPNGILVTASHDYCIDATEVTSGAYLEFLKAVPDGGSFDQPAYCSWNTDLRPADPMWPYVGEEAFPVSQVDWCDAWSYCKWAGKRLCGKIGPGDLADVFATDPARSQWYRACAGEMGSAYPYGDTFDPTRCNGVDNVPPQPREVRTFENCKGHEPGLFDMSGNVYEWIDVCAAVTGPDDSCRMAGGAFNSPSYELACGYRAVVPRSSAVANLGFRCCKDL